MIRAIETRQFLKRHNPKIESKVEKQKKLADIARRLREVQASKKPGKERINLIIDEIIELMSLV